MKKIFFTLAFMCVLFYFSFAQLAYIPDANFRNFLKNNGYVACFQGDSLDTTCTAVVNAVSMYCDHESIYDLTGIQYFDNLHTLYCDHNNLLWLPPLPSTLVTLVCYVNQLSSLPVLPPNLETLSCPTNPLGALPALPNTIKYLYCYSNGLSSLPTLPDSLINLECMYNSLTALPALPPLVQMIWCYHNQLSSLPALPSTLKHLLCNSNNLSSLPPLPPSLLDLYCSDNLLSSLPALPPLFNSLNCDTNLLTNLPALSNPLQMLKCRANQLTSLPVLPQSLRSLYCNSNQITSIGSFPDSLGDAYINDNPINCLPEIHKINNLHWDSTGIHCLPNYGLIANATPSIANLNLCQPSNGCPIYWNISGKVFFDLNGNCIQDAGDSTVKNIQVALDSGGAQLQSFLTNGLGNYAFRTGPGNYTLRLDTTNLPLEVICPVAFYNYSMLSAIDSLDSLIDFSLQCRNGFDLFAKSISPSSMFSIGHQQTVYLNAGDAAKFYGVHCAVGVNGSVQAILQGLVSYVSPAPGALTPTSINGDTITWIIPDFSLVDPVHDFNIIVEVSSSATINDSVCVQLNVFPTAGDNIPANNSLSDCFPIRSSFDPNEKYMSPSGVVDTSQQWFTFTIFFQNTGNAPAEDIYILDTLDQNLDATTFTYLASSHDVVTQLLPGNILRFNYPDIYLADSTTSEPASHGYVQFKIKRKENIVINTTISNTAYIYFDFNAAVATNRVEATFASEVGVGDHALQSFTVYPNPAENKLAVGLRSPKACRSCDNRQYAIEVIEVYNLLGEKIIEKLFSKGNKLETIDVDFLKQGIYFLKVQTDKGSAVRKFVKE